MSAISTSGAIVTAVDEVAPGNLGESKEQPLSTPAKVQAPPRQVPVRSATIFNEGARGQDSRYPPDRPGEAAGDNGRAWKIYKDRVKDIDDDLLEGWNDTLNTLLVFAGLFSAACTAFLIEVSKNLQPDWQQATSLAVFAIYTHLNSTSPAPFEVPNPLSFAPAADVRWINGLWFTSLALSLVVSFLAILAKQWLNEFKSRMRAPSSSPKMWALRHSAFKGGLERWGMDAFVSTLPLLLHAALFLFLAGLCVLLMPLDDYIVAVVMGITAAVGTFYIVAGLAPLFWGDCPSATPMLRYLYSLWSRVIVPSFITVFSCIFLAHVLAIAMLLTLIVLLAAAGDVLYRLARCRAVRSQGSSATAFCVDKVAMPLTKFLLQRLPIIIGLDRHATFFRFVPFWA